MEKLCDYCGHVFKPKRSDSLYCSASCRQMAYMGRRLNSLTACPSIGGSSNSNETPIDACENKAYLSIDGYTEKQETSIDTSEHHHEKLLDESNVKPYQRTESSFLNGIADLVDKRNYLYALLNCMHPQNMAVQKTSIRLKCLAECLLMFSEAKLTELDDLKEVCNAFTMTMQSHYYKQLPVNFPYTRYILSLRDRLRRFIITHEPSASVRFRLSKESKTELIATRYELSEFFPNTPFCNLNFSE